MQPGTQRHARPTPPSFSLLAALLLAGAAAATACGDDGSVLGEGSSAGSSGQASGGSAGSGHAGTQASGGTTDAGGTSDGAGTSSAGTISGGTSSSAGANSSGGATDAAGAGGQARGGQASSDCVGTTCTANQSCVAYRTVGGGIMPPDAEGKCMAGRHLEGNMCQADFGYTCAELTGCSAPAATCRCAPSTPCSNSTVCRLPSDAPWLDTSAELVCELQAP